MSKKNLVADRSYIKHRFQNEIWSNRKISQAFPHKNKEVH